MKEGLSRVNKDVLVFGNFTHYDALKKIPNTIQLNVPDVPTSFRQKCRHLKLLLSLPYTIQ